VKKLKTFIPGREKQTPMLSTDQRCPGRHSQAGDQSNDPVVIAWQTPDLSQNILLEKCQKDLHVESQKSNAQEEGSNAQKEQQRTFARRNDTFVLRLSQYDQPFCLFPV